jgi:hypothetical protein
MILPYIGRRKELGNVIPLDTSDLRYIVRKTVKPEQAYMRALDIIVNKLARGSYTYECISDRLSRTIISLLLCSSVIDNNMITIRRFALAGYAKPALGFI